MIKSLVDEDLGVAVDAKDVLHAQISRDHNFGSQVVFGTHSQILNEMAKNEKETLRMRLYDFVVAVAKVSILFSTGHNSQIYYDGPNCVKEIFSYFVRKIVEFFYQNVLFLSKRSSKSRISEATVLWRGKFLQMNVFQI